MELPAYHLPSPGVLGSCGSAAQLHQRAGTIILLSAVVLWFLKAYGVVDGRIQMVEDMDHSISAFLGNLIAPIFVLGLWYLAEHRGHHHGPGRQGRGGQRVWRALWRGRRRPGLCGGRQLWPSGPIAAHFTALSGFSFLIFNLLCAPCFAAIGAIRREMNSARWTLFAVGYLMVFAYVVSFIIFQLGTMIGSGFALFT